MSKKRSDIKPIAKIRKQSDKQIAETFASPVCYAGSEELRAEYQDDGSEPSKDQRKSDVKD